MIKNLFATHFFGYWKDHKRNYNMAIKKNGILFVFLFFIITGSIFAQETEHKIDKGAVYRVFLGSKENDDLDILDVDIDDDRLVIKVRNTLRNDDIEITDVEVVGMDISGRIVVEIFPVSYILKGREKQNIRVRLKKIIIVIEVSVNADIYKE